MRVLIIGLLFILSSYGQKLNYKSQIDTKPTVDSRQFSWTRISGTNVSGNLSAAGVNVLTFPACPASLQGTYQYIKVHMGTGTAEWVPVSSVTPVGSGCTVVITTANVHTGAWRLYSNGIREGIGSISATGGTVTLPTGTIEACHVNFAGVTNIVLKGQGMNATRLMCTISTTLPTLEVLSAANGTVEDLAVWHESSALSSTAVGLLVPTTGSDHVIINRVLAKNNYHGFMLGRVSSGTLTGVIAAYNSYDGINFDGTATIQQWELNNTYSSLNGRDGFNYTNTIAASIAGPRWNTVTTFANARNGIRLSSAVGGAINGTRISNAWMGSDNGSEIYLDTRGYQHSIIDGKFEMNGLGQTLAGGGLGWPVRDEPASYTGYGIEITANNLTTYGPIALVNNQAHATMLNGIYAGAPTSIIGGSIIDSGAKHVSAGGPVADSVRTGIHIASNKVIVNGVHFASAGGYQLYGIYADAGIITGTILNGNYFDATMTGGSILYEGGIPINTINPGNPVYRVETMLATCSTTAAVGATCDTTFTFSTPVISSNYTATCSLGSGILGVPTIVGIGSKTTTNMVVKIAALTAVAASSDAVQCHLMYK
jgi:hypothetical protein